MAQAATTPRCIISKEPSPKLLAISKPEVRKGSYESKTGLWRLLCQHFNRVPNKQECRAQPPVSSEANTGIWDIETLPYGLQSSTPPADNFLRRENLPYVVVENRQNQTLVISNTRR
ncbi:hypothetical protein Rs2_35508 [Raphanus sativus]|nr:hypothetical protein Rs2_35508 [Raphanus sativus]